MSGERLGGEGTARRSWRQWMSQRTVLVAAVVAAAKESTVKGPGKGNVGEEPRRGVVRWLAAGGIPCFAPDGDLQEGVFALFWAVILLCFPLREGRRRRRRKDCLFFFAYCHCFCESGSVREIFA